ncbi:MAG: acetyl-CoA carboxylase biotin carboxyl carrier protein [Opitutaceae bacterium]|nr:acetyl-CoA carboxylase biotin carboxyl carrier protein [Opitutaceae bacterium]
MKRSDLTAFELEEEGFKIKIKRGSDALPLVHTSRPPGVVFHEAPPAEVSAPAPRPAATAPSAPPAAAADEVGIAYIKSPMVGTFYRASSPESKAFVEVGTKVSETSVVCIIEAMKIMNEIQAEAKGTILEFLVENGQPVEYGQRLFKIKQD